MKLRFLRHSKGEFLLNKILIILLLVFIASGCDIFNTRSPEEPTADKSDFDPPTQPVTVIRNLISAVNEMQTDNYSSCFSDTVDGAKSYFEFYPPSDAIAIYGSVFDDWNLDDEERYFYALTLQLSSSEPLLVLDNDSFEYETEHPDSVVYVSDYLLTAMHRDSSLPTQFQGTLQFTIKQGSNGLWSIQKWIDLPAKADSSVTWSILKAKFSY